MRILLLVVGLSGVAARVQAQEAPLLLIGKITLRSSNDNSCNVELRNANSQAAIAWVIQRIPDRRSASGYDMVKDPELAVQPGASTFSAFSCNPGETVAIEVGAVLYSDGTVVGSSTLLDRAVLETRRRHARGLRQLVELLSSAPLDAGRDSASQLRELIGLSVGTQITSPDQLDARMAVDRATRRLGSVTAQNHADLRAATIEEIGVIIRRLESLPLR